MTCKEKYEAHVRYTMEQEYCCEKDTEDSPGPYIPCHEIHRCDTLMEHVCDECEEEGCDGATNFETRADRMGMDANEVYRWEPKGGQR